MQVVQLDIRAEATLCCQKQSIVDSGLRVGIKTQQPHGMMQMQVCIEQLQCLPGMLAARVYHHEEELAGLHFPDCSGKRSAARFDCVTE